MNFYSEKNVYEAGLERIRWIFDEFKDRKICVSFSGGKDSTTVLHLCKEVMDERGIKKIPVFFCDQEVEAPQTIDYVRQVMSQDWVEPFWVQSSFKEWNASAGEWFNVWGEGEEWCREKEDISIKDIPLKKDAGFGSVLDQMHRYLFGDDYVALGGVRIEESPTRRLGLTTSKCYKDITWGANCAKGALVLYPIWDWRTYDVWYYILSNHFPYCELYNYYMTMKPLLKCRVSSFIHENAIQSLTEIKEIAPQFYEAAMRRVKNVNTTVQTYSSIGSYIGKLPPYFNDWQEYIEYLSEHLVADPKNAKKIVTGFKGQIKHWREKFGKWTDGFSFVEQSIGAAFAFSIVCEDFELSKVRNRDMAVFKYYCDHKNDIERANQAGVREVSEQGGVSE